MRHKKLAFLSCAVAVASLFTATAVMAWDPPRHCAGGGFTIDVSAASPCRVSSATFSALAATDPCTSQGDYTGILYTVTGYADYVTTLVTENNLAADILVFNPMAPTTQIGTVYDACTGDMSTGLGRYSCHERAVRVGINRSAATQKFWVLAKGTRQPIETSIALKKGTTVKSFAIVGLGLDTNAFQTAKKTETVNFKGCAVDFVYDSVTGAVQSAALNEVQSMDRCIGGEPAGTCCSEVISTDVGNLTLNLNVAGVGNLGLGRFGDGYISSGDNSCTTRVIGAKVYTWGSPCP
jgi:hypothetical protein